MYKEKIEKLIAQLSCGLYERDECLKLLLLSMFAGKSIFLFGPPGTAKSMIARRASEAFKVDDSENKFFDYLMNRFSTPEEIFGPIDIAELKKNNLKRQTQGYLPNAHFAFLDEIWKSSPAILNTLLTIINERIYKSGKDRIKVPLKGLVCASNEFPPENQGLEALYDRMIVRYFVGPLEDVENFEKLLFDNNAEFDNINIDAFSIDELALIQKNSKNIPFSDAAKKLIRAIKYKLEELRAEKNQQAKDVPYVSDRRWKNCVELLRVAAFLGDKNEVDISDISLLRHVLWEKDTQREFIYKIIEDCILMFSVEDNSKIKEIQKDFQRLEQLCDKEPKLIYKRLADDISKEAQTLINNLENTLTKITTNANPFITKNDINLAFAPLANNIKELNNIVLGVEELVETKLNENTIKQQQQIQQQKEKQEKQLKEQQRKKIIEEFKEKLENIIPDYHNGRIESAAGFKISFGGSDNKPKKSNYIKLGLDILENRENISILEEYDWFKIKILNEQPYNLGSLIDNDEYEECEQDKDNFINLVHTYKNKLDQLGA